ncbi:SDR family oxidoreductase [Lentzea sp. NPDC005914]|uniref:SDR family NAD(P)-dependent oxidoreductase n=1 Tax=Lentzea sp. NPDC005914 TaxID=3154572 RepID=UPI00340EFD25
MQAAGGEVFAVRARLGTPDGADALFAELAGGPLDIVVNNAGGGGHGGTIEQTTTEQFGDLFAVNVAAPFFILQRALPLLRDRGRIINISSCAPRVAAPQQVAYAMTKGAMEVLSKTLAVQLGPRGITVNSVAPGATDTAYLRDHPEIRAGISAITALGRVGQPSDIADVVAFLASDDARWITGTVIDASGGTFLSSATGR